MHDHVFPGRGQDHHERRTWMVIMLTASMMVIEIISGLIFGSMALLADGWHMASHAAALSITVAAYFFARRHARNPRFCFGTGKVGELAGFSSALLLAGIALIMAYESFRRFLAPVSISFDEAIAVAVIGLTVNLVSAWMLGEGRPHEHDDDRRGQADHNIRAAYVHVLADALTSILAIAALMAGRFQGWAWMDPAMGIVGAVVIARWSYNLLVDTGSILLDMNVHAGLDDRIRERLEDDSEGRIDDLHVWRLGPGHFAAIISLAVPEPRPPSWYKSRLDGLDELSHVTVEVNPKGAPRS